MNRDALSRLADKIEDDQEILELALFALASVEHVGARKMDGGSPLVDQALDRLRKRLSGYYRPKRGARA